MSVKTSSNKKPSDVLIIGDSMIKRLQVYGHPMNVWKFCYPGGTAEDMNCHIPTEKLPGEALIGAVLINMGTNDVSRGRNRIRTISEVFESIKSLIMRMASLYPQAVIVYISILPRLDYDHDRAMAVNRKIRYYISKLGPRYESFNHCDDFLKTVFPGPRKIPIREYYRDLEEDTVHLSDSGTQVQQDVFNRFLPRVKTMINENSVDLTNLMWQTEWDRFNYWVMKTPNLVPNRYLVGKRITNFTAKQHMEVINLEKKQKTREFVGPQYEIRNWTGPQTRDEAEKIPGYRHLGE